MAAAAFVAIFAFDVPFPIIVLGAGLVGAVAYRISPSLVPQAHRAKIELDSADSVIDHLFATGQLNHARPSAARLLRVLLLWSMLWITPIALLAAWQGVHSVFVQQGLFFSQAAVVTFGGAYSVLSYVAQRAVEDFSWLHPGEMLDGLALAETTPGPLILVLQFVAYVGAYRASTDLSPLAAGILGAGVCLWVTFIPCFLWIFLGAPYIEALRNLRILNAAMSCITAAVVGVILNLSVWFALHTLFTEVRSLRYGWFNLSVPNWSTLNIAAFVLTVAALVAMLRLKISMPATLLGCALLGWLWLLY
jgi:chromate transporter